MPGGELDVTFGYDLLGQTTSASQTGDSLTFAYDALGRNVKQSGASGDYESQYDLAGRRTRIDHPDTFFVTQEYLVTGEMTRARENGSTVLATFDYDALGRRERLTLGNGAVTTYEYDPVGRLWKLGHDLGGADMASDNLVTLTYNSASQIVGRHATNDAYAWTGHGNGSTASSHDGLNRLTSQTTGQSTTGFTYDLRGNRLNDGLRSYTYDSENKARGVATAPYHYDPLGRLSGAGNSPGSPPAIAYENYLDRLVAERTPGSSTVQRRHVFGPGIDEPLVWYEGSSRRYLQADERGSIVAVTSDTGGLLAINRYDEYGRTETTSSTYMGRFLYTGQRYFGGFGLYHYKNRMYDPTTGRFMQPDPIGYGSGMNLYGYVNGDPVNFRDPLGLCMATLWGRFRHNEDWSESELLETWVTLNGCGPPPAFGGDGPGDGGDGGGMGGPEEDPCNAPLPDGSTINQNVDKVKAWKRDAPYLAILNPIVSLAYPYAKWFDKVRPNGDWDYKKYDPNINVWAAEGNLNYGATGIQILPLDVLLRGAGFVQDPASRGKGHWTDPPGKSDYGDQASDIPYIKQGAAQCKGTR